MSAHPSIFPKRGIYTSIRRPDDVFWSDTGTQSAWIAVAYIDTRCGTLKNADNIAYVPYASEAKERLTTLKPVAHSGHYVQPSLKGIRENILGKIDEWLQDVDGHGICWIRGLAGSGKSNVAFDMISRLAPRLASSVFIEQGDAVLSNTAAVWRTVTRDLIRIFTPNWVSGLKTDPERSSIYSHFESLFTEPLTKKDECYSPSTNHIFIIDALDECSLAGKQNDLLDTISHKSRLPSAFKLTVTERDKRLSGSHRWSCMQIKLPLGADIDSDIPQDIYLFIKQHLADISHFPAGRLIQIVLDALATVAAGVFIWVETALRFMRQGVPYKRHDGEMNATENINRHYHQALGLPCLGSNDHPTLGVCKRTVTAIVLTKIPLLGGDFAQVIFKLRSLGNFILDKLVSVISIRHGTVIYNCDTSFRDLLRNCHRCTRQFYIGREPIICLRLIREAAGFNICGFVKLLPDRNVDDLSEHISPIDQEESAAQLIEYIKGSYLMYWLDGNRITSGFHTKCVPNIWDGQLRVLDPNKGIWDTTIRFSTRFWNSLTGDIISHSDDDRADCVRPVVFSPDGKRVVSGSYDKHTSILDVTTEEIISSSDDDRADCVRPASVVFSSDGKRVVSGPYDKHTSIWDVTTEEIISGPNDDHTDCIRSATLPPDSTRAVFVSDSSDRTIWDLYKRKAILGPYEDYTDYISSVAFSSSDWTICIWDVNIGQVIAGPLKGHADCIRLSPDGRRVVSGSSDSTICIWNNTTLCPLEYHNTTLGPLECHTDFIGSVAFSPDSKRVVPGSSDKAIDVGDVDTVERFSGPMKSYSKSASLSFDSKRIVSGSDHQSRDAQTVFGSFEGYSNQAWSVTFPPDGKPIASSSDKFLQTGMASVVHVLRERAASSLDTILRQSPESKSNTVTSHYCGDTALEKVWHAYPRYRFTQSHLKFLGTLADLRDQPGWIFPTAAKILFNVTQTDDVDTWSGQVEGSEERGMFLSNSVEPVEPVEPNPSSIWPNIWSFI